MFNNSQPQKKPNRMLEVFAVVVVAALALTILVELIGSARGRTENLTTISQMREYRQAMDVFFLETGYFPNKSGQTSGATCLGDYADDTCWENGESVKEDADILGILVPNIIPNVPTGSEKKYGVYAGKYYVGAIYKYSVSGRAYEMQYFLKGNDQPCTLDDTVATNVGKDTLCTLSFSL